MLKQVVWHTHDCACHICKPKWPLVLYDVPEGVRATVGDLCVIEHWKLPDPDARTGESPVH